MSKARQSKRQRYRKPRKEYSEGSRVGFADSGYVGGSNRSIRVPSWQRQGGGHKTPLGEKGSDVGIKKLLTNNFFFLYTVTKFSKKNLTTFLS